MILDNYKFSNLLHAGNNLYHIRKIFVLTQEDDEQTRDLRLKIEEQKRKREEILKWKELRRLSNLQTVKSQFESQSPTQHMIKSVQQRQGQVKNRVSRFTFSPNSCICSNEKHILFY